MSGSIITNRFRHHTMVEFMLPLMLVAVSAAQLARPLNFDEAIYFTIARDIRRLLVPAWTWDGHSYVLFANSPGLLLYLAAPLQQWSSGVNIVMTRVFIVTVFLAVPTVAVWSISRKRYGLVPAGIGVGLAFATSIFFDESFRFRLDMPLGAVSGAVLLFYHEAAQAENRRSISLLAAIVLIVISFWIKFQAVCALASVLTYWFHVRVSSRRPQFRHLGTAAISLTIAAVIGFVAWVTFMRFAAHHLAIVAETPFGHPQQFADTVSYNLARISDGAWDSGALRHFITAGLQPLVARVGFLVLVVAIGWGLRPQFDSLSLLAAHYCFITLAFNLAVYQMPGAGGHYLAAAAPAVCLLFAWSVAAVKASPVGPRLGYAVSLAIGLHIAMNIPKLNPFDTTDPNRIVAAEIARRAPNGVVALSDQMWSVGYFAERRLAHLDVISAEQAHELFAGPSFAAAVVVSDTYLRTGGHEGLVAELERNFSRTRGISLRSGENIWVYFARGL